MNYEEKIDKVDNKVIVLDKKWQKKNITRIIIFLVIQFLALLPIIAISIIRAKVGWPAKSLRPLELDLIKLICMFLLYAPLNIINLTNMVIIIKNIKEYESATKYMKKIKILLLFNSILSIFLISAIIYHFLPHHYNPTIFIKKPDQGDF